MARVYRAPVEMPSSLRAALDAAIGPPMATLRHMAETLPDPVVVQIERTTLGVANPLVPVSEERQVLLPEGQEAKSAADHIFEELFATGQISRVRTHVMHIEVNAVNAITSLLIVTPLGGANEEVRTVAVSAS